MNDEVLVRVDNVSKKFCKILKRSLWYGMCDTAHELNPFNSVSSSKFQVPSLDGQEPATCNLQPVTQEALPPLRADEFWAVKNVSFELRRGECLGLIGHNGAGKSTLLKMLNGLIKPDTGRIEMHGRIGALIELGAGFNPILTGRENIYNKGAILGFTKKEIDKKFDEIVDFAEIEEFIDMPVQNYSTGMKVRLGFSVSAMMEPDVLIIDEVLAVGDIGFRIKCMSVIRELMQDSVVILVSHSMPQIAVVSTHIMMMERGAVELFTDSVGEGVVQYFSKQSHADDSVIGDGHTRITKFVLKGEKKGKSLCVDRTACLEMGLHLETPPDVKQVNVTIYIYNIENRIIAEISTRDRSEGLCVTGGHIVLSIRSEPLYLNSGTYSIHVNISDAESRRHLLRHGNVETFVVDHFLATGADVIVPAQWMVTNGEGD